MKVKLSAFHKLGIEEIKDMFDVSNGKQNGYPISRKNILIIKFFFRNISLKTTKLHMQEIQ
ncbi:hypothetical protein D8M04_04245 [Oceanobacillus piezotolerans]|uniref:Uncharacterized protein n=1 Tax=Oceanobacillus piezotolerans TaxID=2448030 RepID=A0A498DEG8_9BACI|nr:hypothetical protein D8M04_04245 [Oceanobacillus piezotolerans]